MTFSCLRMQFASSTHGQDAPGLNVHKSLTQNVSKLEVGQFSRLVASASNGAVQRDLVSSRFGGKLAQRREHAEQYSKGDSTLFCALLRCHQPDCAPFEGEEQSSLCGTVIFRRAVIGFNRCVSAALNAVSNVLVVAHDG